MKIKRLQIIAVICTFALSLFFIAVSERALRRTESESKYRHFLKDKTEYDVIFLGTSHVGLGFSPMELWNEYGITSYNFGISAASLPTSVNQLKVAVQYHKPKIAVLDVLYSTYDDLVSGQYNAVHDAFDYFPLSKQKIKSLYDLFPSKKKCLEYIFPYTVYHNRWTDVTFESAWDAFFNVSINNKNGEWDGGFSVSYPAVPSQTTEPMKENTLGMDYIKEFISFCEREGIVPILVTVPYPADEKARQGENSVQILADSENVPYYNLQNLDVIDYATDLTDSSSHLNSSGRLKVTLYLGKILQEKYNLSDHRKDSFYNDWNESYKNYSKSVDADLQKQTDFKSCLMMLNNPSYTAQLSVRDDVELDAIEQKLILQIQNSLSVEFVAAETGISPLQLEAENKTTGSKISKSFYYK